ncbi:hypothetical protein [Blastococcus mobilis]|uniref:Uncharacterized protein n=1 Tax=Blastococcus mobilis TaxID=1938746 RepID=A0A238Z2C8_9ACTN|nr:hypothetical protein [Blastococcus mobilis]SNR77615.1 hypothetical protein SAMN06272737_12462 [Blastococcus mobilis]
MWWLWVLVLVTWLVVGCAVAVLVGRSICLADRRGMPVGDERSATADLLGLARAEPVRARSRRRSVPLPPIGIALVAIGIALETVGYVSRLYGLSAPARSIVSMDAPFSLPRVYVAALFAAAALAAIAGAGIFPGRRTWWTGVGLVAAGIALVKVGSTLHRDAFAAVESAVGASAALVSSGLAAAAVVGALWFLSREERRDRRRILGVLSAYAVASVGLSAISNAIEGSMGFRHWAAAGTTYVEESAEVLCGVAFLVAVLVGVAPRLVLPADWALRRSADEHTLDLPEQLPSRAQGPARS